MLVVEKAPSSLRLFAGLDRFLRPRDQHVDFQSSLIFQVPLLGSPASHSASSLLQDLQGAQQGRHAGVGHHFTLQTFIPLTACFSYKS